jgi:ornithine cyclodeaminase/alanine dehydrogenase-like protein (mu-crystallin family)
VAGRTSPDEITFFKSVGVAVQDAAVAHRVLSRAESDGLGVEVDL